MVESFRRSYPVYIIIDTFLIAASFVFAYLFKYLYAYNTSFYIDSENIRPYSFIFILWALFIIIAFSLKNLHTTDRSITIPQELGHLMQALFLSAIIIAAIIFFAKYKFFSRQVFVMSSGLLFLFLGGFRIIKRMILRRLIQKGFHNINVLIVGANRIGRLIVNEIKKNPWWGFKVVGFLDDTITRDVAGLPVLGCVKDFVVAVKKMLVDETIIALSMHEKATHNLINEAKMLGVGTKVVPVNFEEAASMLTTASLGSIPLLTYKERIHHPTEFIIKRILDAIISLVLIILLLPGFLIIALMIKLDSSGPMLYSHGRIGMKGKKFKFYKFRSMVENAEKLQPALIGDNEIKGGVIFKIKHDPRITGFGKFLRRFSLDELPQLFNVLKGDMSLVGPRPPLPDEVEEYSASHMQRLSIRPGLTGLSQVRGRSELSFQKYVKWDLWYVNNWSFMLDMRVLLWTIPVVLKGKGAY